MSDLTSPIRISAIDGKGFGYVATRKIKAGTLLLQEQALQASYSPLEYGSIPNRQRIQSAFQSIMNQAMKVNGDLFSRLHASSNKTEEQVELLRITDSSDEIQLIKMAENLSRVSTNCFQEISANGREVVLSLSLNESGFNHSCLPNAIVQAFSGGLSMVYASANLEAGEEITIRYISQEDVCLPRALRQTKIYKGWGFNCLCKICSAEESSESKSRSLTVDEEKLAQYGSSWNHSQTLKILRDPHLANNHWLKYRARQYALAGHLSSSDEKLATTEEWHQWYISQIRQNACILPAYDPNKAVLVSQVAHTRPELLPSFARYDKIYEDNIFQSIYYYDLLCLPTQAPSARKRKPKPQQRCKHVL